MKYKRFSRLIPTILITLLLLGVDNVDAQTNKKILNISDLELWRSNSVTLSDDGNWYTVLYVLSEKPEQKGDSDKENIRKADLELYGEDYRTDILYICNGKSGIKYRIPGATNPIFSSSSDWIAYSRETRGEGDKEESRTIELRNLATGDTIVYISDASFQFTEDKDFFITSDKTSLQVYDLKNRREYYIGDIGEYILDNESDYIAYTISTEDLRGNGIYLFNLNSMSARALKTGSYIFSNLSWNSDKSSLAAYMYQLDKDKIDYAGINLLLIQGINSDKFSYTSYPVKDLSGMPDDMGLAVKTSRSANEIVWATDHSRLYLKIKEYETKKTDEESDEKRGKDDPTVSVWHWKDQKLLSQQMLEEERNSEVVYDALFVIKSKTIIQLSSKEIQRLISSRWADNWAVGTDNRDYISDWDVRKNDIYSINLTSGEKKLIEREYSGSIDISPDGEGLVLWKDNQYWYYNFSAASIKDLTSGIDISFVNEDNDHFGSSPSYGFAGWVKGQNAVIVNHKLDLWLLPLDGSSRAENLTNSAGSGEAIRLRIDDMSFEREHDIADRYIDLSSPLILSAFNLETKYAGFYELNNGSLKKLIYKPAYFSGNRGSGLIKAKKSDAIIYRMGDYQNFPEAYLSKLSFSRSEKITNTNPQQKEYNWGHRILIDYTNDDGVPLQGVLSIPDSYKKGQKLPMIVYSYEKSSQGMYQYATPALSGSSICEMIYVSDGYLFLRPDIHFNVGTPHSDMHECIDAALEKVIELGYVDEKHIGYEGFSYGGHTGMFISTQENRFAAIAAGAGVSNLVQGFNIDIVGDGSNEQDYYMTGQGRLGTDPTSNTNMYLRESAVFNAAGMNTPLLLFHGTADNVVQWEHSFGFYSILRYLKKPVVFLSYQGEGHGLRKKSNRIDIQTRLKEYFDYYLKGKTGGAWITEGVPYLAIPDSKGKETERRPVPVWR